MDPVLIFAMIGALGIGAQWLAWRLQLPAIVLMLAAGLIAGPVTGIMNPQDAFGDLFRPIIAVAVAVILFEGGLTLNFRELRETGEPVRRLIWLGAPLAWLFSTLAIHYGAGLSIEASAVFGGILIVTGPTVITPLLRQSRLASRPASVLRWESIVNDPVGALAAVLAFEVVAAVYGAGTMAEAAWHLVQGIVVATLAGWTAGRFVVWAFLRGLVPEYMKVPVLFGLLLVTYALTDLVLHESGLLAVTLMGIIIANAELPSLTELRRFKEHATVILVSGVFVMLAASLDVATLGLLDWRALLFVVLVVFLARPLAVLLALVGTEMPWRERVLVGWIGPRGVVAVAVSGLFGARLAELGVEDGAALAPLAFALVAATVVIHGFSLVPLARALDLTSTQPQGVIIVGASRWGTALGAALAKADLPVMVVDGNYWRLRRPRDEGLDTYHGEILSEAAEHRIPMNHFGTLIAATENDAYNALICTDFGPEFGRSNVFQVGRHGSGDERGLPITLSGRALGSGMDYEEFSRRLGEGYEFRLTGLTDDYGFETYLAERPNAVVLGKISKSGAVSFASPGHDVSPSAGEQVLALVGRERTNA